MGTGWSSEQSQLWSLIVYVVVIINALLNPNVYLLLVYSKCNNVNYIIIGADLNLMNIGH